MSQGIHLVHLHSVSLSLAPRTPVLQRLLSRHYVYFHITLLFFSRPYHHFIVTVLRIKSWNIKKIYLMNSHGMGKEKIALCKTVATCLTPAVKVS